MITAAGDSREQFLSAGFNVPKSLVDLESEIVIQAAIESYVVDKTGFFVAVNQDEAREWGVGDRVKALYPTAQVVSVPTRARGALVSALMCSERLDLDSPLVIAAGDSSITGGIAGHINFFCENALDSAAIVFESSGSRWSYVATDENDAVVEVSEKFQIGHLATTGVFFFRQAKVFMEGAEWVLKNNASVNGNFYVSTVMNHLISLERKVGFAKINSSAYKPRSTPADFYEGSSI